MLPIIIAAIENPEDRDLMTDFFLQYRGLMYNEAQKYLNTPEDVEDIVYEALAKVIDKMETFRDLKHWQRVQYALTTVKNLAYIFLKRSNRFTFVSFDEVEYEIPDNDCSSMEETVEEQMLRAHIKQVWRDIDLDDRILLEQKYILRWSDEELANHLSIQPQSVRMRLTRAKRKVLKEMQKRGLVFPDLQ